VTVVVVRHHLDDCAESFLMSALHNGDSDFYSYYYYYYYYYYCYYYYYYY